MNETTIRTIKGVTRVKNDGEPTIKVPTKGGEYVVRLETSDNRYSATNVRKTYDLRWTVWVATPAPVGGESK